MPDQLPTRSCVIPASQRVVAFWMLPTFARVIPTHWRSTTKVQVYVSKRCIYLCLKNLHLGTYLAPKYVHSGTCQLGT